MMIMHVISYIFIYIYMLAVPLNNGGFSHVYGITDYIAYIYIDVCVYIYIVYTTRSHLASRFAPCVQNSVFRTLVFSLQQCLCHSKLLALIKPNMVLCTRIWAVGFTNVGAAVSGGTRTVKCFG